MADSISTSTTLKQARENAGFATAADFAKRHNLTEVTYRSHENGTRPLTMDAAKRYARILGISWLQLIEADPVGLEVTPSRPVKEHLSHTRRGGSTAPVPSATNVTGEMLKVLGMAEGGPDGWAPFNGETVDIIRKPDNLLGTPNAYGVFVSGSSMEPTYYPGWVLHVHPGKPVNPGCFVLVQRKPRQEGDTPLAVVKRLVRRTASKLVLEQLNPVKTIEVPMAEVMSVHRIVGSSEG